VEWILKLRHPLALQERLGAPKATWRSTKANGCRAEIDGSSRGEAEQVEPGLAGRQGIATTVYAISEFVRDGGSLSYGVDLVDLYRRAATYVDRILRGANPGDLPVQFPTKFEMVANVKTAKALGLTVPQSILVRADEVIE
jgi:hypothetical protein